MKNRFKLIIKAFSFILIVLSCSCVNTSNTRRFYNIQQEEFDKILTTNRIKASTLKNKVLEKEFSDSIKLVIGKHMDSTKLFVNWKANIKDISSKENSNKSVALSFVLEYYSEDYSTVSFHVDYVIPKDSLSSDKIYQTVKKIDENTSVYFDGFIRTKTNGETHDIIYSNNLFYGYPDFQFFIIDIGLRSKGDTLSDNLRKAVYLTYEAIDPIKLNFRKKISKKESDRRAKQIAPKLKDSMDVLTDDERAYIKRLYEALIFNYLYAE